MAKRAKKKREKTGNRGGKVESSMKKTLSPQMYQRSAEEAVGDDLEDAFFYESPFPPEVMLDPPELEAKPLTYTPSLIARRRKLRTVVAMVVGVAATIMTLGVGKTLLVESDSPQSYAVAAPDSP